MHLILLHRLRGMGHSECTCYGAERGDRAAGWRPVVCERGEKKKKKKKSPSTRRPSWHFSLRPVLKRRPVLPAAVSGRPGDPNCLFLIRQQDGQRKKPHRNVSRTTLRRRIPYQNFLLTVTATYARRIARQAPAFCSPGPWSAFTSSRCDVWIRKRQKPRLISVFPVPCYAAERRCCAAGRGQRSAAAWQVGMDVLFPCTAPECAVVDVDNAVPVPSGTWSICCSL